MPEVVFTSNLQRHVDCEGASVAGNSVREALEQVFQDRDALRGYILDEQNRLRKHMVIFVDGQPVKDREQLSDTVEPQSQIYVMQALSGG